MAASIAAWMAAVSSWVPSPTAPPARLGHRTSIHGRPEQISTSPLRVAVPVVDNVEKSPGACASALACDKRGAGQRRRRERAVDPVHPQHRAHQRRAAKAWPVVAP